jgi:nitrogen fixation/metabolism regulation signal transduction histidine kinase
LQRKLKGKLDDLDDAVLHKSVKTIVDQVDAMKRLVNEFRDYARLPSADLKPVQLNALISDLMVLYTNEPSDQVPRAPVITVLDPTCPRILGDEQQLRQVIHNLLQNAQDACEVKGVVQQGALVSLRTEWNVSRSRVRLTVTDTGPGFEPNILKRAFREENCRRTRCKNRTRECDSGWRNQRRASLVIIRIGIQGRRHASAHPLNRDKTRHYGKYFGG